MFTNSVSLGEPKEVQRSEDHHDGSGDAPAHGVEHHQQPLARQRTPKYDHHEQVQGYRGGPEERGDVAEHDEGTLRAAPPISRGHVLNRFASMIEPVIVSEEADEMKEGHKDVRH